MKGKSFFLINILLLIPSVFLTIDLSSQYQQKIYIVDMKAPIYEGTADYIERIFNKLNENEVKGVVILLDTNGGLLTSLEKIVDVMKSSPVEIAVYVPPGGKAFSAGAFIFMAADITAMSPGTALGACEPRPYDEKTASALEGWIKSLAESKNRSKDVAGRMVSENLVLTAEEAKQIGIADYTPRNLNELLVTLGWDRYDRLVFSSDFKADLLNTISTPYMTWFLMLSGVLLLLLGLKSPTFIGEGLGLTFLAMAFYGFGMLDIGVTAFVVIVSGAATMFLELKTGHGIFSLVGTILLIVGLNMIYNEIPTLTMGRSGVAISILGIFFSGLVGFYLYKIHESMKRHVKFQDINKLIGMEGVVKKEIPKGGRGIVYLKSENWSATADNTIKKGSKIKVVAVEGIILKVEKVSD